MGWNRLNDLGMILGFFKDSKGFYAAELSRWVWNALRVFQVLSRLYEILLFFTQYLETFSLNCENFENLLRFSNNFFSESAEILSRTLQGFIQDSLKLFSELVEVHSLIPIRTEEVKPFQWLMINRDSSLKWFDDNRRTAMPLIVVN